jgi:hypothetical protein
MSQVLKVILICIVIGAAIGVAWAGLLTMLQRGWHRLYADPKKYQSWVFGPILCAALSVGPFVEERLYLGGTLVLLVAAAFFFLVTSAIRASVLDQK